jgi:hypothetical protein
VTVEFPVGVRSSVVARRQLPTLLVSALTPYTFTTAPAEGSPKFALTGRSRIPQRLFNCFALKDGIGLSGRCFFHFFENAPVCVHRGADGRVAEKDLLGRSLTVEEARHIADVVRRWTRTTSQ